MTKTKSRKVSAKEKLEIYDNFFHRLHFLRYVACDEKRVAQMLVLSDNLIVSQAKNDGVRPLTEEEVQSNVTAALEKMKVLP